MKKLIILTIIFLFIPFLLSGCTSSDDYETQISELEEQISELQSEKSDLQDENDNLKEKLDSINTLAGDRSYNYSDILSDIETESSY